MHQSVIDGVNVVPMPGFDGAYWISADGRAWTYRTKRGPQSYPRPLASEPRKIRGGDHKGYVRFALLTAEGKRRDIFAHQLVAELFIGPCPVGNVVNHKDGNKRNNTPANLEYVTLAENTRHAYRAGLAARGERRKTTLTNERVMEIRRRYVAGLATKRKGVKHPDSTRSLAREFGISWAVAHQIVTGQTWRHLLSGADTSFPAACLPDGGG